MISCLVLLELGVHAGGWVRTCTELRGVLMSVDPIDKGDGVLLVGFLSGVGECFLASQ